MRENKVNTFLNELSNTIEKGDKHATIVGNLHDEIERLTKLVDERLAERECTHCDGLGVFEAMGENFDETDSCLNCENGKLPPTHVIVPIEPTHRQLQAMTEVRAVDDEGPFPPVCDLLGFSGENKTRTVVEAMYKAMIEASNG